MVLTTVCTMAAQAPTEAGEADAAYQRHDWQSAQKLYEALTHESAGNARYWYRLGVAERGNRHYAPALEAFRKAGELGVGKGLQKPLLDYELATTYSAMGDREKALTLLKSAAEEGFMQDDRLDSDAEWNTLRNDQQFADSAKEVKHNAHPCQDPEFG